jgi:hypothetical protein
MSNPTVRNQSGFNAFGGGTQTLPQPLLGSVILVWCFAFSALPTCTDSAGNTYTVQAQEQDANGNWITLFTGPVTAAGSGTLTLTLGGLVLAMEVQGVASGTFIDGSVTSGTYNSSAGGLLSSSAITASFSADLIVSAAWDQNNAAITVNTGTLVASNSAGDTAIVQAHSTSGPGSYVESFNVPASSGETAVIVAIALMGTVSGPAPGSGSMALAGNAPGASQGFIIRPAVA